MVYGSVMHETIEYFWEIRSGEGQIVVRGWHSEKGIDFFKSNWKHNCMSLRFWMANFRFRKQGVEGIVSFIGRYHASPCP